MKSRFRYCNVVWGNCGTSLINKLQHLQSCAFKLIYPESESIDISTAFKQLSLLNIQQLIDYSTTSMVHDSFTSLFQHTTFTIIRPGMLVLLPIYFSIFMLYVLFSVMLLEV